MLEKQRESCGGWQNASVREGGSEFRRMYWQRIQKVFESVLISEAFLCSLRKLSLVPAEWSGCALAFSPTPHTMAELAFLVYGSWFQWESRTLSKRRLTIISLCRHCRPNDGVHRQSVCLPRASELNEKRILCCLRFRVESSRNLIPNRERHPRSRILPVATSRALHDPQLICWPDGTNVGKPQTPRLAPLTAAR